MASKISRRTQKFADDNKDDDSRKNNLLTLPKELKQVKARETRRDHQVSDEEEEENDSQRKETETEPKEPQENREASFIDNNNNIPRKKRRKKKRKKKKTTSTSGETLGGGRGQTVDASKNETGKGSEEVKKEDEVVTKSRGFIPALGTFFTWIALSLVLYVFWALEKIDTYRGLFVFLFLSIYFFLDEDEEEKKEEESSSGSTQALGKFIFFTCLVTSLVLALFVILPLGDLYEWSEPFGTVCVLMYLLVFVSIAVCLIYPE